LKQFIDIGWHLLFLNIEEDKQITIIDLKEMEIIYLIEVR
jgi:hypothetical protein